MTIPVLTPYAANQRYMSLWVEELKIKSAILEQMDLLQEQRIFNRQPKGSAAIAARENKKEKAASIRAAVQQLRASAKAATEARKEAGAIFQALYDRKRGWDNKID